MLWGQPQHSAITPESLRVLEQHHGQWALSRVPIFHFNDHLISQLTKVVVVIKFESYNPFINLFGQLILWTCYWEESDKYRNYQNLGFIKLTMESGRGKRRERNLHRDDSFLSPFMVPVALACVGSPTKPTWWNLVDLHRRHCRCWSKMV